MTPEEMRAASIKAAATFYASKSVGEDRIQKLTDKILRFIESGEWDTHS